MLKITIEVKEKDAENCTIKLIPAKETSKASKEEVASYNVIMNELTALLQNLQNK